MGSETALRNGSPPVGGRETSHPPADLGRRVGAPGGGFASPVTRAPTTSSYRPPVRRSADGTGNFASPAAGAQNVNGKRPPLGDLTNVPPTDGSAAVQGTGAAAADPKRMKVGGGFHGDLPQAQQASLQQQHQSSAR